MKIPSRALSRLAAVGLLTVAAPMIAWLAVAPVASHLSGLREEIEAERMLLGRLAMSASQDERAADLERRARAATDSNIYLKGDTDPATAAALQRLLGELAAAERIRFASARALEPRQRGGVKLAGARVQFQAEIEQARALLYAIEAARPFLLVESLQVHPLAAFAPGDSELAGKLDIRIDVFGAMAPARE